jgi:hypothetical protein
VRAWCPVSAQTAGGAVRWSLEIYADIKQWKAGTMTDTFQIVQLVQHSVAAMIEHQTAFPLLHNQSTFREDTFQEHILICV